MSEMKNKKLPIIMIAVLFLAGLILVTLFVSKSYWDAMIVKKVTAAIQANNGGLIGSVAAYDSQRFRANLDILMQCRNDCLSPMTLRLNLPLFRKVLFNMGYQTLSVDKATRDNLEKAIIADLKRMSGQDFGDDASKWKDWLTTHDGNSEAASPPLKPESSGKAPDAQSPPATPSGQ